MSFNKFLHYAFMCHKKPERSFFFRGKQFPLCARCTGIAAGYIVGIIWLIFLPYIKFSYTLLLILPMIIDGCVQYKFKIMSNNVRRFVTGLLGGIAIIHMIVNNHFLFLNTAKWLWQIILN